MDDSAMSPQEDRLIRIAYHEAGHVAMNYLCGFRFIRGCTISPVVVECWRSNRDNKQVELPCQCGQCNEDIATCLSPRLGEASLQYAATQGAGGYTYVDHSCILDDWRTRKNGDIEYNNVMKATLAGTYGESLLDSGVDNPWFDSRGAREDISKLNFILSKKFPNGKEGARQKREELEIRLRQESWTEIQANRKRVEVVAHALLKADRRTLNPAQLSQLLGG